MKLAFVSGPFSHEDEIHGIEANINEASRVALKYWRLGFAVICPHKNTQNFQHARDVRREVWYDGDMEILKRCDVVIMCGEWWKSEGAIHERNLAFLRHIPIIYETRSEVNE